MTCRARWGSGSERTPEGFGYGVTYVTIQQIEFELEKAGHGMALAYDAERVMQLRSMLVRRVSGNCPAV